MSREIKFRAWDKFKKEMRKVDKMDFHNKKGVIVWFLNGEKILYPRQSTEIMQQFTGLKDRKGVEIYEGDIIEISYKNSSIKQNAKVVFEKGCFFADLGDRFAYHIYEVADNCEVIGDIHENSELLK